MWLIKGVTDEPLSPASRQEQKAGVVAILADRVPPVEELLVRLKAAEEGCAEAFVDENDYTVLSWDDLGWECELLKLSLSRRVAVIDNQVRLPWRMTVMRTLVLTWLACHRLSRARRLTSALHSEFCGTCSRLRMLTPTFGSSTALSGSAGGV